MVAVDEGRQGQHRLVGVGNQGEHRGISDDIHIFFHVFILSVKFGNFMAVHTFFLIQRFKSYFLRGQRVINEGALDGVEVMGANGHQGSAATHVLVKLILRVNEGFIVLLIERHVSQDTAHHKGADLSSVLSHDDFLRRFHLLGRELHGLPLTQVKKQVAGDAFGRKQVVAVAGDFERVLSLN